MENKTKEWNKKLITFYNKSKQNFVYKLFRNKGNKGKVKYNLFTAPMNSFISHFLHLRIDPKYFLLEGVVLMNETK